MSMIETIRVLSLFNAEPGDEPPAVSVGIGSGVAALGVPDGTWWRRRGRAVPLFGRQERLGLRRRAERLEDRRLGAGPGPGLLMRGVRRHRGCRRRRRSQHAGPGVRPQPPLRSLDVHRNPAVSRTLHEESTKGDVFGASVAHCSDGTDGLHRGGRAGSSPAPGQVQEAGRSTSFGGLEAQSTPWSTSSIANPNPAGTATDQFGASVAINVAGDGSGQWHGTLTLAVGAPGANDGEGAVYVGTTTSPGSGRARSSSARPWSRAFPMLPTTFTPRDLVPQWLSPVGSRWRSEPRTIRTSRT